MTLSVKSRSLDLILSVSSLGTGGSKDRICTSTCAGMVGMLSGGSWLKYLRMSAGVVLMFSVSFCCIC